MALSAWQSGWGENPTIRRKRAETLKYEVRRFPLKFRTVSVPCYRKRFLYKGDLVAIVMRDESNEGATSWTTDIRFAEQFKGLIRPDAVSAAIFKHTPEQGEVIISLQALWADSDFVVAANAFRESYPDDARGLFNFTDSQSEVILEVPLRGSEIIALTGVSSSFDELCDTAGAPEAERNSRFKELIDSGAPLDRPQYLSKEATQRAISNTIRKI